MHLTIIIRNVSVTFEKRWPSQTVPSTLKTIYRNIFMFIMMMAHSPIWRKQKYAFILVSLSRYPSSRSPPKWSLISGPPPPDSHLVFGNPIYNLWFRKQLLWIQYKKYRLTSKRRRRRRSARQRQLMFFEDWNWLIKLTELFSINDMDRHVMILHSTTPTTGKLFRSTTCGRFVSFWGSVNRPDSICGYLTETVADNRTHLLLLVIIISTSVMD